MFYCVPRCFVKQTVKYFYLNFDSERICRNTNIPYKTYIVFLCTLSHSTLSYMKLPEFNLFVILRLNTGNLISFTLLFFLPIFAINGYNGLPYKTRKVLREKHFQQKR